MLATFSIYQLSGLVSREMLIGDCQKLKALGWQPVHSIASIVASQGA